MKISLNKAYKRQEIFDAFKKCCDALAEKVFWSLKFGRYKAHDYGFFGKSKGIVLLPYRYQRYELFPDYYGDWIESRDLQVWLEELHPDYGYKKIKVTFKGYKKLFPRRWFGFFVEVDLESHPEVWERYQDEINVFLNEFMKNINSVTETKFK